MSLRTALPLALALLLPTVARADERWAIPGDQAAAVFALLPKEGEPVTPTTLRLRDVEIRHERIEVCAGDGAARRCVTLLHPSLGAAGDGKTRFFAVRPGSPPDPALTQAVAGWLSRNETTSPWTRVTTPGSGSTRSLRLRGLTLVLAALLLPAIGVGWWLRRRRRPAGAPPPTAG